MSALRLTTLYRDPTGPDDTAFCHRAPEAPGRGWFLPGDPAPDLGDKTCRVICGQTIIKNVEGVSHAPGLDLSAQ